MKLKRKAKEIQTNSVKNGELWIKEVSQIDLLVLKCLDIYLPVKLVKVQEIGDDIYIFTLIVFNLYSINDY
ncbi:MAG: hypothetical protein IT237_00755 [Bacteroidia bacterium]|nr:hypothetical protein [Bacteroidia bacterium]